MKERRIELFITGMTPEGFGVAREENGKVVFVPDAAIGDRLDVSVIKELKNSSIAKLNGIISPSPDRIDPDCAVCRKCGGCVFRHISYESELALKRGFVAEAFRRIGGEDIAVGDVISGGEYGYRNKVQYPLAPDENGNCAFGYYARRSHRIVPHEKCFLQDGIFDKIAAECCSEADRLGVKAYDEGTGSGVLRHLVMRRSRKGELSVCLVVNGKPDEKTVTLAKLIYDRFDCVTGVHLNRNDRRDNVIFGDRTLLIAGDGALSDTLCGKKFSLSPRAFYQVNAVMAEKLYEYAASLIGKKSGVLLDLYCGAGTVGICAAKESDRLFGVEIIPEAVENAFENARANGRTSENTFFVAGDAAVGVEECTKRFGRPDVITVDPPRKGLEKAVIETVVSAAPEKVIYISCDPATLARDCAIFAEKGYKTSFAQPFDLFPRTGHVETVVLMTKK